MTCEIAVLALDLSPMRLQFLNELFNTLNIQVNMSISIIGDIDNLPKILPNANFRRPEDVIGFKMPEELPVWYQEQLLAIAFAAKSNSPFSLILPIGSFILHPLTEADLLPRTLARTSWEPIDLHVDWWDTAAQLTRRRRFSEWEGTSILPAVLSRELARWTLDIIRRENGQPALDVLIDAARSGRNWSAMSVYTTASGSRFTKFHHDSFDSTIYPLLTRSLIWNQELGELFGDSDGRGPDLGLMTYVQISEIHDLAPILDRLYRQPGGSGRGGRSPERRPFHKLPALISLIFGLKRR